MTLIWIYTFLTSLQSGLTMGCAEMNEPEVTPILDSTDHLERIKRREAVYGLPADCCCGYYYTPPV